MSQGSVVRDLEPGILLIDYKVGSMSSPPPLPKIYGKLPDLIRVSSIVTTAGYPCHYKWRLGQFYLQVGDEGDLESIPKPRNLYGLVNGIRGLKARLHFV